MTFQPSELALNPDGSIYHLNLHPDQVATTILTVGDPDRVPRVSKYFDKIEVKVQKREFVTHTGWLGKKRITVISSGIGTDNIDIVINELDALANIDFKERKVKEKFTQFDFIRVGTSGCLQKDIEVESIVVSAFGIGLDNLMHYYDYQNNLSEASLFDDLTSFQEYAGQLPVTPYVFESNLELQRKIGHNQIAGMTLTSPGFYAPQGRQLRGKSLLTNDYLKKLSHFESQGLKITNFEMETSGIYGLCRILGHRALSCNVILANRMNGTFSKDTKAATEKVIKYVLEKVSEEE